MGRKRNENSNNQRKKENQNSEKSNSIPSFRILSCSSLMSGLAKSRYVLNLTCLILDFDKEKEKKKASLQEVPSQQPIHTWTTTTTTTTTTGAFHSPSVPFSTKYTPGTVQFSFLSYHCWICISISSSLCFS